jgi:hypothetical protein
LSSGIVGAVPFAPGAAPLLRVSLSGVGAAAVLRSSIEAWTLPLAWRVLGSVFAGSVELARRCR